MQFQKWGERLLGYGRGVEKASGAIQLGGSHPPEVRDGGVLSGEGKENILCIPSPRVLNGKKQKREERASGRNEGLLMQCPISSCSWSWAVMPVVTPETICN